MRRQPRELGYATHQGVAETGPAGLYAARIAGIRVRSGGFHREVIPAVALLKRQRHGSFLARLQLPEQRRRAIRFICNRNRYRLLAMVVQVHLQVAVGQAQRGADR